MVHLPKYETRLYFILWFSIFGYVMYKLYEAGNAMKSRMPSDHFGGWTLFGRDKDVTDIEWSSWSNNLLKLLPWLTFHPIAAETTRLINPEAVPVTHFFTTISFLLYYFPPAVPLFYILLFLIFFLILRYGGVKTVWLFGVSSLIGHQFYFTFFFRRLHYEMSSTVYVSVCWFHLRCISFVLSELMSRESTAKKFISFLGYVFYLPPFFSGPLFPYDLFKQRVLRPYICFTSQRLKMLCKDLLKVIALIIILEILFRFFYCYSMRYSIDHLQRESLWALDGVCVCMAKLFYLKYLIYFGLPIAIMKFELYDPFPLPTCVFRVYLYSKMWRDFDRGFYLFMHKYIYLPLRGCGKEERLRRLFASLVCFSFSFVWHGSNKMIFIWFTVNYIGVTCEAIGSEISRTKVFSRYASILSPSNRRRLNALINSPLLILGLISNFIFFGGLNLGMIYLKQLGSKDIVLNVWLLTIGYIMCQVAMEVDIIPTTKIVK